MAGGPISPELREGWVGMMKTRRFRVWGFPVLLAGFSLALGVEAYGQNNVAGSTALENARAGSVQGRAPGNLVTAGMARAQAAANWARGGIEITETSRPRPWRTDFLVDAISIIFDELNSVLTQVGLRFFRRAGGELEIPTDFTPPTSNGDESPDTTRSPSGSK